MPEGEGIGEMCEKIESQKVPGLDLKSTLNAPGTMIAAPDPGVGESAPMTETPAAVRETHGDITLRVRTMAGAQHAISASASSTVRDVLPAVRSKLELPSEVSVRIVLGDTALLATQTLSEAGVQDQSVVTAAVMSGFNIVMTGYSGPNTPRFGMSTKVNYTMSCSCGYVEHFQEEQGYVMTVPCRETKECPKCKAGPSLEQQAKVQTMAH